MAFRNVYVIDDDLDVRCSLSMLFATAEMPCRPFRSGNDFLDGLAELAPGNILLDLRMPELDGFGVMRALQAGEVNWPVTIMTAHGDIPAAIQAIRMGAHEFLEKPFEPEALLATLDRGFAELERRLAEARTQRDAATKLSSLSEREREILRGLLGGMSNKAVAHALGISVRTAEMHRARMMRRLSSRSLADALALAVRAGIDPLPHAAAAARNGEARSTRGSPAFRSI
jgi:two-component system response regulator FixJ